MSTGVSSTTDVRALQPRDATKIFSRDLNQWSGQVEAVRVGCWLRLGMESPPAIPLYDKLPLVAQLRLSVRMRMLLNNVRSQLLRIFSLAMDVRKEALGCFRVRIEAFVLGYKSIYRFNKTEK
jgi:hypothetical protein